MAAVAFTAIITLTGCGTKLYDMTDEEQGLIANYSAYVVAKHNIYQQDGMTNATEKRGDMEDADDTEKVDEASPDNSLSQDNKTSEAGNDKSSNSQKEPSATQEKKVSLAEATGYGSLEITYDGVNESDVYNEGSYYSITAGSGNTFAVMKFTLKNPTDEDINVDMFGNRLEFLTGEILCILRIRIMQVDTPRRSRRTVFMNHMLPQVFFFQDIITH